MFEFIRIGISELRLEHENRNIKDSTNKKARQNQRN